MRSLHSLHATARTCSDLTGECGTSHTVGGGGGPCESNTADSAPPRATEMASLRIRKTTQDLEARSPMQTLLLTPIVALFPPQP